MTTQPRTPAYQAEIRLILQIAMVLFIYTVVIGILNGLDITEFGRRALLTHLHVGTLGWLTMAVFAAALWLFGTPGEERDEVRWAARAAPVTALLYNVAFLTTDNIARPILGTLMMIAIAVFFFWALARARTMPLSVPHLGVLAGLGTSIAGAILGITNAVRLAQTDSSISELFGDAHPAMMVVGFLVPVGLAFSEWMMRPESVYEPASRAGQAQVLLPFLGGVMLVIGIFADSEPIIGLSLPLEILGIAIFAWRMWPVARTVSWLDPGLARHGVTASIFVVVNLVVFVYLIGNYIDDFEAAPRRLVLALDHSIFVGVLTNAILAMIGLTLRTPRPDWVDHVVFWGFNAGIAVFLLGLLADQTAIIRVGTPVLGAAILLAVFVHLADAVKRFRSAQPSAAAP